MRMICIILMLFLSGCATCGRPIDSSMVEQIQKGITTKEDVVKRFGQPDTVYFDKDNRIVYSYNATKAKQTAWNFIPVVNIVHSEVKMKTQMFIIVFSNEGIVEEYSFINSDKLMKYGIML